MAVLAAALLCLSAFVHGISACSPPFSLTQSICVSRSTNKMNWCDAQSYCRGIEGELLQGDAVLKAIENNLLGSLGTRSAHWIGATDMAEEQGNGRVGWRWTNGSIMAGSLIWETGEPGNKNADCLKLQGSTVLADYRCGKKAYALCQPANYTAPTSRVFEKVDFFVGSNKDNYAKGACSTTFNVTDFCQDCTCHELCLAEEKVGCVAFYSHEARTECTLIFYTDAQIDVGNGNGWEKFVEVKEE